MNQDIGHLINDNGDIVYKRGEPEPMMENHIRLVLDNKDGQITFIEQTTNPTGGRPGRTDIKTMDGRIIQTRIDLVPADEPGNRTELIINEMKFNNPIKESFFSQQNMKSVR